MDRGPTEDVEQELGMERVKVRPFLLEPFCERLSNKEMKIPYTHGCSGSTSCNADELSVTHLHFPLFMHTDRFVSLTVDYKVEATNAEGLKSIPQCRCTD